MPTWAMWAVCGGLLLIRALLSASESALYGTSDLRAKELAELHGRSGRRVLRHKTNREATAAALRLALVLTGFTAAAIGALVGPQTLGISRFDQDPWVAVFTSVAGAVVVGTIASLFDVTLRAAASANPERWVLRLSWLVSLMVVTLYPVMRLLVGTLNLALRPFGTRVRFEAPPPPLEELEKLLAAQAAKLQVDQGAPQLIRSIFELTDKTCRDLMVPRTDVVALDITTPPDEILRILAEENHSRMPVYREDPDHIVGILHVRDLIPMMQHPELIVLPDIIRPAQFVPWVKPIGDLLRDMQRKKIHMSIVVDEYGGFMGLVTLEDILREIVGDIGDEFDVEVKQVEKQPDGSFLVDASMAVDEFAKTFGVKAPDGEYETVGGFLTALSGSLPDVGERFSHDGWQFAVHAKEGPRIARVRLSRLKSLPPISKAQEKEREADGGSIVPPRPSPSRS
ncbi:MAG: hemolysin family protein [Myxococcaceae bacterium]